MQEIIEELKHAETYIVPLEKLKPNPWNPNEMGETAWKALGESIVKYGIHLQPLVVRPRGDGFQIIDGEHRYKWACEMGLPSVSAVVIDVDDYSAKKLTQILNRTRGEDNPVALKELLDSLLVDHDAEDVIKGMVIANEQELDDLLADLERQITNDFGLNEESTEGLTNDVPEPPEDPITKPGDLWILGNHRLLCGDSTNPQHVERLMDGKKADMIFTDPPYGIAYAGKGISAPVKSTGKMVKGGNFGQIKGDETTAPARDAFSLCQALNIPLMVWWGANYYCDALPGEHSWIVWNKEVVGDFFSAAELAWTNQKGRTRMFTHMWHGIAKASESGQSRVHPTQKPVALAEWAFSEFDAGNIVLDLFGGSGSTLIACEKTNRHCRMMELDPAYCDVIIKRWEDFTGLTAKRLD